MDIKQAESLLRGIAHVVEESLSDGGPRDHAWAMDEIASLVKDVPLCGPLCECPCHSGGIDVDGVCKQPCTKCDGDFISPKFSEGCPKCAAVCKILGEEWKTGDRDQLLTIHEVMNGDE